MEWISRYTFEHVGHENLLGRTSVTFGVVRLIGHHLEAIFSLLKQHNLDFVRLSEAHDTCRGEIEVTQIVFEDSSNLDSFAQR